MILCRTCEHWYATAQWKGNCKLHNWQRDKWSETTEPSLDCKGKDFVDKYAMYQVKEANEKESSKLD